MGSSVYQKPSIRLYRKDGAATHEEPNGGIQLDPGFAIND